MLNDGAGVSYRINQFTHRSGSLATVVETYLNKGGVSGGEVLRSSLPILRQRSAAAIGRLAVDERFKKTLRAAAAAADTETAKATTTVTDTAEQQTASPPTGLVDLPTWLEAAQPKWQWRVRFQTAVYHQLDRITRGCGTRLMIFMPPRHGKSELVTIRYSAWRLTRDPGLRIVIGSYNQRLANKFSRSIKRACTSAPVGDPFADEPALGLNAMEEWETLQGGGVKAVGAGAGADLIIIDDPIKSRAAAESKNNRERVWEWFTDDLMTRPDPNGAVILIQTRWHEDDLAGRFLRKVQGSEFKVQSRKRDGWSVIRLPALAEGGEEQSAVSNQQSQSGDENPRSLKGDKDNSPGQGRSPQPWGCGPT